MATANFEIGNKEFEVRFIRESGYPPTKDERGSSLIEYDVTTYKDNQPMMKKEIFNFSEALRRMKEGKKVRRIGWGIVDKLWIDKDKNINIFYKATTHSSEGFIHIFPSCWSYFTCEDILATDWEEVE